MNHAHPESHHSPEEKKPASPHLPHAREHEPSPQVHKTHHHQPHHHPAHHPAHGGPLDHHDHHAQHGGGHSGHGHHSPAMFKQRFFVALLLTLPILYFSPQIQTWLGYQALSFPGSGWITPLLGVILYGYGGWPFLQGAWHEFHSKIGMMTLIALAITVAFVYSLAVTLGLDGMPFYWELATLIVIMLLGHWIEMASVEGASKALEELSALVPNLAHRIRDEQIEDVPVSEIGVDEIILIRPGEQIPNDGEVIEGSTLVNESFLTGESKPVYKEVGSEVLAGSVNTEGAVQVRVSRIGEQTAISQIMRLVEEAQTSRSRYQVLADKVAYWLTIIAISVGTLTFAIWLPISGLVFAINRAVTVLVITCPHALGLAIPLVIANSTGLAARNGILLRNREALERAKAIKIVAFDKTGTLTQGKFGVQTLVVDAPITGVPVTGAPVTGAPVTGTPEIGTEEAAGKKLQTLSENQALAIAAALETNSEHPLAQAIVEAAGQLALPPVTNFQAVAGQGVEGQIDGQVYRIGRPEWARSQNLPFSQKLQQALIEADERGESAVALMRLGRATPSEGCAIAVITLADQIREQARETITRLHDMGIQPVMITGDAEAVAKAVAQDLNIDRYYARVLPEEKVSRIKQLKQEAPTAFVGDGINDAAALLEADMGLAIGAGTNVAIESADLVLIEDDPLDAVKALRLAQKTYRKMIQNLLWATGYNIIAIPLAAGALSAWGVILSPAVGALLMSFSTVIVAINAVLLRRAQLT